MTTVEFLRHLRGKHVRLSVDGERLHYLAPKGIVTAQIREELRNRKDEIIRFLRKVEETTRDAKPAIERIARTGELPLSFAQQRLWFIDQLIPSSPMYNMPGAVRLQGKLDPALLAMIINELVRRHESLRTTFTAVNGEPRQIIADRLTLNIPAIDLQALPETARESEAERLARLEAQKPFDLARGPLLRTSLIRLADESHVALFTMHHIVSDGWSMGVLIREVALLREAFSQGKPSPLPELPIQYADFAQWQRSWLSGKTLEAQLSYWKNQLQGVPSVLELPTDRPRPRTGSHKGASQSLTLSRELSDRLHALSQQEGVTLFMMLLASFQTLLYRYTGQQDILVGSPIANRNRFETEGLIGFFINTLVLRGNFSGNPTFREFLERIRETILGAYGHQDIPFERIVEELEPERNISRSPLFQVMFNMAEFENPRVAFPGLTVQRLSSAELDSKFDLTLYVQRTSESIGFTLAYNLDLFDADTIRRNLGHLETLLEGIAADLDRTVSSYSILSERERQQLLRWNAVDAPYPEHHSMHALFERQVERAPESVALVYGDEQLSYAELNRRANQLARHLRSLGVGPEFTVGILMHRSPDLVVSIFGILKAGGTYVPLDLSYPKERLVFMIEDSDTAILVTHTAAMEILEGSQASRGFLPTAQSRHGTKTIFLDQEWPFLLQNHADNLVAAVTGENAAYITYTSGSTGRPKGVMSCHGGAVNYLAYVRKMYQLEPEDVTLQLASLSFDASVRDIIAPLVTGARLSLVPDEIARDPVALLEQVEKHRITCILSVVPTLLNTVIQSVADRAKPYDSVRLILVSGEALHLATVRRAKDVFSRASVVNQYGPTETTMTVSYFQLTAAEGDGIVPLGTAIPNDRIYVLDRGLDPTPVGMVGQIYIGGVGVTRGYVKQPVLTAEKFLPDTYGKAGMRVYATGDLGRYAADGALAFLGRADHQVKIRGFRIELGEIEGVLRRHPAVREAMVVAGEGKAGDRGPGTGGTEAGQHPAPNTQYLAAYIVSVGEPAPRMTELRNFLKATLPDYMVPSAFVFLERFPLTPNGKVDVRALPEPAVTRPALEKEFVAPRTSLEESLAGMWREVLAVERVGVHDSFFELGGHSLLAIQLISRVRNEFQIELPLRPLFEKPTIEGLAEVIENVLWVGRAPTGGSEQDLREEGEL